MTNCLLSRKSNPAKVSMHMIILMLFLDFCRLVYVDHEIEKHKEDEHIQPLLGAAGWAAPAKSMK